MKHDWEEYGGDIKHPFQRLRKCRNCGAQQEHKKDYLWMRVVGHRWYPKVGRCKPPKMTYSEFNKLSPAEKWKHWRLQHGSWLCPNCGDVLTDGPNRASPFHGCSVHCSKCDGELTRRTGGGMGDPFRWVLGPKRANRKKRKVK